MPETLRKVSCWPANDASGRSSAVADERTAKVASGWSAASRSYSRRTSASNAGGSGWRLDPGADLGAGGGERAHVVGVERGEPLGDAPRQAAFGEEGAKRVRRGREAARHADAGLAQLADHFAEGGVLAADRLDVGHSQGVESGDEGGRQVGG